MGHTGTPTNAQNKCIKLFNFGVNVTKLCLHWEIKGNISC